MGRSPGRDPKDGSDDGDVYFSQEGLDRELGPLGAAPVGPLDQDDDQVIRSLQRRRARIRTLTLQGQHEDADRLQEDEFQDAYMNELALEMGGKDPLVDTGGTEYMSPAVWEDRIMRHWGERMDAADLVSKDSEWLEAEKAMGVLFEQVREQNKALMERARTDHSLTAEEFVQIFDPVVVSNEQRSTWNALLDSVHEKLQGIHPNFSVYTHPSTRRVAQALTGLHGMAPWHQVAQMESGLFRTPGVKTEFTEVEASKADLEPQLTYVEKDTPRGPEREMRWETPEQIKQRTGHGMKFPMTRFASEDLGTMTHVLSAVRSGVIEYSDTVIGGATKAVENSWWLADRILGGLMGESPIQIPKDYVTNPATGEVEVLDRPFGLPEMMGGLLGYAMGARAIEMAERARAEIDFSREMEKAPVFKVMQDVATFTGGMAGFMTLAGPALAGGAKAGAAAGDAVTKGMVAISSMGRGLGVSAAQAARLQKYNRFIGQFAGGALAMGGYEAMVHGSDPESFVRAFEHGAITGMVMMPIGMLGKQAERMLMRKKMPAWLSQQVGAATEGLGFAAYGAISGEGAHPSFGNSPMGQTLWDFLREPTQKKWDRYVEYGTENILGMMTYKAMFGAAGRHELMAEKIAQRGQKTRRELELAGARAHLRVQAERGEFIAPERRIPFGALLRGGEEYFEQVGRKIRKEAEGVVEFEKKGTPYTPTRSALLEHVDAPIKPGETIEAPASPSFVGRLMRIAQKRLTRTGEKYEKSEIGVVWIRDPEGGAIGKGIYGRSARATGTHTPSVGLGEFRKEAIEILSEKYDRKTAMELATEMATFHTHPTTGPFSAADLNWFRRWTWEAAQQTEGKRGNTPHFVVTPDRVYAITPDPKVLKGISAADYFLKAEAYGKELHAKAISAAQAESGLPAEVVRDVYLKFRAGKEIPHARNRRLADVMATSMESQMAELAGTIGLRMKTYKNVGEAQRAFNEWVKTGKIEGFTSGEPRDVAELKPSTKAQAEKVTLEKIKEQIASGPTDPAGAGEIKELFQKHIQTWIDRHPSHRDFFEGKGSVPDAAGLRDRITAFMYEAEPAFALGLSSVPRTPGGVFRILEKLGIPHDFLPTWTGVGRAHELGVPDFGEPRELTTFGESEGRVEAPPVTPEPATLAEQGRVLSRMFDAQEGSRYKQSSRRVGAMLKDWASKLGSFFTDPKIRERVAERLEKLGYRRKFMKLKQDEQLVLAETDRVRNEIRNARYQSREEMGWIFESIHADKSLTPKERQDFLGKAVELSILLDLEANYIRTEQRDTGEVDEHGKPIFEAVEVQAELPGGVTIDAVRQRRESLESGLDPRARAAHERIRTALDQAWKSMEDRGLVTSGQKLPEYYPRKIADFSDIFDAIGYERPSQVREKGRGYLRKRKGTQRLVDTRPEVLEEYLTKVRVDNSVHDYLNQVGSEIQKRLYADHGLTEHEVEAMEGGEWRELYDRLEREEGLVVMDVKRGLMGKRTLERDPLFQDLMNGIAVDTGGKVVIPEVQLGRLFRPNAEKGRYLVTKKALEFLREARTPSRMYQSPVMNKIKQAIGTWKLMALRGLAGIATPFRVARNIWSDNTALVFKTEDGFRALRETIGHLPEAERVSRAIAKGTQEAYDALKTPFEKSIFWEFQHFATGRSGLIGGELEARQLSAHGERDWLRKMMPETHRWLEDVRRWATGDLAVWRKIDDWGENLMRVAYFMRERSARFQGIDVDAASKGHFAPEQLEAMRAAHTEVSGAMVNYNWLTPFERVAMNGLIFPFYTWARHNFTKVAAETLRHPVKQMGRYGLMAGIVASWNYMMAREEEERLIDSRPDLAGRMHLILPFARDEFGNPMIVWAEDVFTEAGDFLGLTAIPGRTANAVFGHQDLELWFARAGIGAVQTSGKQVRDWTAPWIRSMLGAQYQSKYETLGERGENTFSTDVVTMFRPLADLRELGLMGRPQRDKPGEATALRFVPFFGYMDISEGLPARQQKGQFEAGRIQRRQAKTSNEVSRSLDRFMAGIEKDDLSQMERAVSDAWEALAPELEPLGYSEYHLWSRFLRAAEREWQKRQTIKLGGSLPPKFWELSRSQKAELLMRLNK